ncbi:MAG TPA: GNAT family N-acetyltransferase [Edaphocola sp.]|nr:GNAT family N-acetyltransferase [Edaphocola sp.]
MITINQEDDKKHGRFFLEEDGFFVGEMTYTWAGESMIIIDHTGIEEGHNGKGFGKQLLMKVVEFARNRGVKIIPLCPFAKASFKKDTSIQDVLK